MKYSQKDSVRFYIIDSRVVLLLLLFTFFLPVKINSQMRPNAPDAPFEVSISQRIDREKGPLLKINASIDYRSLIFFKKPGLYQADYRVYLNIKNRKTDAVRGEVWEESVAAPFYADTRSISLKSVVKKDLPIDPGDYSVEVIIEMLGSLRKLKREIDIKIVGADDDAISIEIPRFSMPRSIDYDQYPPVGELRVSRCDSLSDRFSLLSGKVFIEFDSWIRASFAILAPANLDQQSGCALSLRISDSRGRVILYNSYSFDIKAGEYYGFCTDINIDDLPIGFYEYSISAVIMGTEIKTERNDRFIVLLNRGLLGEYFPKLLELLSLVADEDDLEQLRTASRRKRLTEWNRFWNKRDSTPTTMLNEELSEFLVRLKYTLVTFSKYRPGWDTDMGRVYISNGRPDRMVDRAGTSFNYGSEFQFWYYDSMNLVYIFRNTMHGGEYQLIETRYY